MPNNTQINICVHNKMLNYHWTKRIIHEQIIYKKKINLKSSFTIFLQSLQGLSICRTIPFTPQRLIHSFDGLFLILYCFVNSAMFFTSDLFWDDSPVTASVVDATMVFKLLTDLTNSCKVSRMATSLAIDPMYWCSLGHLKQFHFHQFLWIHLLHNQG